MTDMHDTGDVRKDNSYHSNSSSWKTPVKIPFHSKFHMTNTKYQIPNTQNTHCKRTKMQEICWAAAPFPWLLSWVEFERWWISDPLLAAAGNSVLDKLGVWLVHPQLEPLLGRKKKKEKKKSRKNTKKRKIWVDNKCKRKALIFFLWMWDFYLNFNFNWELWRLYLKF